ncbi:MAG: NAD-dependent epimerase/dehydratase family protein [Anaerolineales bacterium]|nr:NAD-dependent epimerase/dehydratase family protein [Anaerolineales bacterium]
MSDAAIDPGWAGRPVLVTGATGFIGGALAHRLHTLGARVTAQGRRAGAVLEAAGMRFVRGDLAQAEVAEAAMTGAAYVFHCAALAAPWGPYRDFYRANVSATEALTAAARRAGVTRFVHVSTPSLCFAGEARRNVREDDPLPARQLTAYADTKRLAEQVVAEAQAAGLPTVRLRPRAVFGPGDATLFPRLLRQVAHGRLRVIGPGDNLADLTYIDNVVDGLLLAARAPAAVGGVYNLTNGEPQPLWPLIAQVSTALGYGPPRGRVSLRAALALAGAIELAYWLLGLKREPPLTRYAVRMLALDATLDITAARRDLGYAPRVSLDEGMQRFLAAWRERPQA